MGCLLRELLEVVGWFALSFLFKLQMLALWWLLGLGQGL